MLKHFVIDPAGAIHRKLLFLEGRTDIAVELPE